MEDASSLSDYPDKPLHSSKTHCVACYEPIHPKASRCPHCSSSQSPSSVWQQAADLVGKLGWVSALIALFMAVYNLDQLADEWRQKLMAVDEMVMASKMQRTAGDFEGAWKMLKQALVLDASSSTARNEQLELAVAWMHSGANSDERKNSEVMKDLRPVLYRGATSSDQKRAATMLAYLGRIDYARRTAGIAWLNVDATFKQALKLDQDNLYANTFYALWLISPNNHSKYDFDRLDKAMEHFARAIAVSDTESRLFVRKIQIQGLDGMGNHSIDGADIQLIELGLKLLHNKEKIPENLRNTIRAPLARTALYGTGNGDDEALIILSNNLSPRKLLLLVHWALQEPNLDTSMFKSIHWSYTEARLLELSGEPEKALSIYQRLIDMKNNGYDYNRLIKQLEKHRDNIVVQLADAASEKN